MLSASRSESCVSLPIPAHPIGNHMGFSDSGDEGQPRGRIAFVDRRGHHVGHDARFLLLHPGLLSSFPASPSPREHAARDRRLHARRHAERAGAGGGGHRSHHRRRAVREEPRRRAPDRVDLEADGDARRDRSGAPSRPRRRDDNHRQRSTDRVRRRALAAAGRHVVQQPRSLARRADGVGQPRGAGARPRRRPRSAPARQRR